MHVTRQTVNYTYRITPYQLYNWSGNRSDKFVLSPLEFGPLKLTTHMLHHVPLRFWKWIAEKKRWIWEHFDISNLLITYFSIFEKTFQINDKNLIDSILFFLFFFFFVSVLFRCCYCFFFWSLNKGVFMTSHRALTGCKSTKA